ncbi:hypothetical protein AURDEDRAFT_61870, partial [Auricularia subglabra TFB-10046 SS5]
GYSLSSLEHTKTGLTARLALAGPACNAFGNDYADLALEVTYESKTRLHVTLVDAADSQFRIPESVIARPAAARAFPVGDSELVFNYTSQPFAFWISRRDDPASTPLFDTRVSTALDGFPLVFEDQYLQLTSALPRGANVYGLGEVLASSGFRRDVGTDGGVGTVQALWARDVGDPVDENVYGSHPIYMEHRATKHSSKTHGVFLMRRAAVSQLNSAAGGDVMLLTPPKSKVSLVEYRMIGGVLDFYFLSGPSPIQVIEQYAEIVGLPTWQPYWGFGFQLCRWGYLTINETREQVTKMREANIPLEVMWNDIDLYHAVRDYTTDPVSYPAEEVRQFIHELHANNQRYIPIVDAAVPKQVNDTDILMGTQYDPYTAGVERKVFMTNPDGSEYVGQVWPGYTVFPDWFSENTAEWWTEALANWSQSGVEYDGIWLDMNEVSSFCDGSCGSGIDISNTTAPFVLPGEPGNLVTNWPEWYDYNGTVSGPSGNITVDGELTCRATELKPKPELLRRGLGAANQTDIDINSPPYAIHNGFGPLWIHTVATNATHAAGYAELDTHSLWGLMEEHVTHESLTKIRKGTRPFIISRSTFPSSGKWTGHWLGDNDSKWQWMYLSIQGVLQFQLFQIPMVGADTCGFGGNTNEELCNRWMQLSAFTPFYRNHNIRGAISQEPYRWDSVAEASRTAIAVRYAMLPYWYTLFASASRYGTPPVRALWYEFPTESELFGLDRQFLIGRDILVTPVLEPSATTVDGIFPGVSSGTVWYDWYTHRAVKAKAHRNTTLKAPLGHINVHVRSGAVVLLHSLPAYTITETREGPFELLITLDNHGKASGTAYLDDGVSYPPGTFRELTFTVAAGGRKLRITSRGSFKVHQTLEKITVLGLKQRPHRVTADGHALHGESWKFDAGIGQLEVGSLAIDLNNAFDLALQ